MADEDKNSNFSRFNIPRDPRNPVDHLDTGYEGPTLDSTTIPSCTIEDVDRALFALFDKDLGFTTITLAATRIQGSNSPLEIRKPFVIMPTGERWAITKRLRAPRDRNNALMLPAISIRRTSISQTSEDMVSRGMNQHTGNITIRRRLDKLDRDYQNLVNKLGLQNAQLTPSSIQRPQGENKASVNEITKEGILLDPHLGNNVFELISIPQPQFYTAKYEITFWTSYTEHMNYLLMTMASAYLPQGKMFRLNTPKGYWFIAYAGDEATSADNYDDYTDQEKLTRYTFTMEVKSFILASDAPGNPVAIRRWISAPQIDFELEATPDQVIPVPATRGPTSGDPFTLSNIEEDPLTKQTTTTEHRFLVKKDFIDLRTGKQQTRYVKIVERNQKKGETAYTTSGVTSLDEFLLSANYKDASLPRRPESG